MFYGEISAEIMFSPQLHLSLPWCECCSWLIKCGSLPIWPRNMASENSQPANTSFLINLNLQQRFEIKIVSLLITCDLKSKWMTTLLNHSRKFHSKVTVQRLTIETASNRKFMSNCHKNLVLKLLGLQTLYSWRSQGNWLLPLWRLKLKVLSNTFNK